MSSDVAQPSAQPDIAWHDDCMVVGKGFPDSDRFARLPSRAQPLVNERAWNASRCPAGLHIDLISDAPEIWVRWHLAHEPQVRWCTVRAGAHGVDLWQRDGNGVWRRLGAADAVGGCANEARLVRGLPRQERRLRLYLPYGNALVAIAVGVPAGCRLESMPVDRRPPIVWYGSSLVQGEHVALAGAAHASRVGRALDRTVVNLGFGGGAKLEPDLADVIASVDAACFVIDPLPNCDVALVTGRAAEFLRRLRAHRPETPIVTVEDPGHALASLRAEDARNLSAKHAAWQEAQADISGIIAVRHATVVDQQGDGRTDGIHLTDLGAARLADVLTPTLRTVLSFPRA